MNVNPAAGLHSGDNKAIDLLEKTALIVIIKITIKGFYVCHIKNKKIKDYTKSKPSF